MGLTCYDRSHNPISNVFNHLGSAYAGAHAAYDQTHGAYAQAHAQFVRLKPLNCLILKSLLECLDFCLHRYMDWFMVWTELTNRASAHAAIDGLEWLIMCLPINTSHPCGLHRKALEQDCTAMLQKQRMHFLF